MVIDKTLHGIPAQTAIAIGYFDGVHRGHAAVIEQAVTVARTVGLQPAVFTFDMQKKRAAGKGSLDILPRAEKQHRIAAFGIEYYFEPPFSHIADWSGPVFVRDILKQTCGAAALCCGRNFRFGHNRSCDVGDLARLCDQNQVALHLVDEVMLDGETISSSRMKLAIEQGDMPAVAAMLGNAYGFCLEVYEEKHLARKLGFPTINQRFPDGIVAPRAGVYYTNAVIDGKRYAAVSNVGVRPTMESEGSVVIETHILDYSGDLYGKTVTVAFVQFLRDEHKFGSSDALQAAVRQDIDRARALAGAGIG